MRHTSPSFSLHFLFYLQCCDNQAFSIQSTSEPLLTASFKTQTEMIATLLISTMPLPSTSQLIPRPFPPARRESNCYQALPDDSSSSRTTHPSSTLQITTVSQIGRTLRSETATTQVHRCNQHRPRWYLLVPEPLRGELWE